MSASGAHSQAQDARLDAVDARFIYFGVVAEFNLDKVANLAYRSALRQVEKGEAEGEGEMHNSVMARAASVGVAAWWTPA